MNLGRSVWLASGPSIDGARILKAQEMTESRGRSGVPPGGGRAWIDGVSLMVAFAALGFAIVAWSRPLPVDPRSVPSLGSPEAPHHISAHNEARLELFEFLDENQGRLVRLNVTLDEDLRSGVILRDEPSFSGSSFTIPGPECPEVPIENLTGESCVRYDFRLNGAAAEGSALFDDHGWRLRGYFASDGYVSTRQGIQTYVIYPVSLA